MRNPFFSFFLFFGLAQMSFFRLPQILAQPSGTPVWHSFRKCVNFRRWETRAHGCSCQMWQFVWRNADCYASAQMSWLKQHMGDKNQNSYASYCIHGLAARGFPLTAHTFLRLFFWDISNKMVKLICVFGNLTKWEDLKCVSVIKSPVSCQRATLLQLCVQ